MKMRSKSVAWLAALLGLGLASCTTLRTTVDYDREVDFSKYRTFHIKNVHAQPGPGVRPPGGPGGPGGGPPVAPNDLADRRIKRALEAVLTAKGLRRDDENPDLWVVPHVRLSHETVVYSWDAGWGYGWRWRYGLGWGAASVAEIPIGTLIVDLVDAHAKELVWRGTATDTIDPHASPQEKEQALTEAVEKMFRDFPPGRGSGR
jgi:hypothetical protein